MSEGRFRAPRRTRDRTADRMSRAGNQPQPERTMTMTPKTVKTHRPVEDRVAELEQKIAEIKAREARKQAKARPEAQPLIVALRALDKAHRVADEVGNGELAKAVDSARAALAPAIVGLGLRIPEKAKRGRKRKGEAA